MSSLNWNGTMNGRISLIRWSSLLACAILIGLPSPASARQVPPAAAAGAPGAAGATPLVGPPIARIASAAAVSKESFLTITHVRELPDGNVLLNDTGRRRLLLLDSMLAVTRVVMDSLSESANFYGTRGAGLLPYLADSTLFIDPASYAMVVIDPKGNPGYVGAIWRTTDALYVSSASTLTYGVPATDGKGRVIYRMRAVSAPPTVAPPPGVPYYPQTPDSAFIVGANLDTRRLDTLGVIHLPKSDERIRQLTASSFTIESAINPVPVTDEWAVLADGTVAFVRGRDYRVDYLSPDGTLTSSEKIPYEWQRLLDEDKRRMIDSIRTENRRFAQTSYTSAVIRWVNQHGQLYPKEFKVPEGYVPPSGFGKDWLLPAGLTFPAGYTYACALGEQPTQVPYTLPPGSPPVPPGVVLPATRSSCVNSALNSITVSSTPPPFREPVILPALDLPDYKAPFGPGSVRADMDGNLWVRINPPRPIPGGPVYDVISREGSLTNRIQLPTGYTLVGFGRGKTVYLSVRDATGLHLARVRLR
jgi:hypothetical protein